MLTLTSGNPIITRSAWNTGKALWPLINVRLRAAKVRFSKILDYSVYCTTLAKERKEEKSNCRVTFLHYHELTSRVQPVDFQVCSPDALKWPVPSPQKLAPSQGEWETRSLLGVSSAIFYFFDIAKGISWLGVTLMGSPITRNFCSENRFIVQEGYLRMRNGFTGSVDLNWVDDIIWGWKVFFIKNLNYSGLLLSSAYANKENCKTITSTIYRIHTSITLSTWILHHSFETIWDERGNT